MFLVAENILLAWPPPQKGFFPWSSSGPGFLVTSKPGWAGGSQPSQTPEAENEEGSLPLGKESGRPGRPQQNSAHSVWAVQEGQLHRYTCVCVTYENNRCICSAVLAELVWLGDQTEISVENICVFLPLGNPRTEEPGGLQPGGKRVGHDLATNSSNIRICVCVCVCVCVYI